LVLAPSQTATLVGPFQESVTSAALWGLIPARLIRAVSGTAMLVRT
jgi:hypothetical protein